MNRGKLARIEARIKPQQKTSYHLIGWGVLEPGEIQAKRARLAAQGIEVETGQQYLLTDEAVKALQDEGAMLIKKYNHE